jgi:hypothetical protein
MEEGESLVGVTVVVVVVVMVLLLLLSHESLAEETTTTTTTLPNYQPFLLLFLSFSFFLVCVLQSFTRQTQKLMQISTLHNFPQTNPTTYANFNTTQLSRDKPNNLCKF